MRKKDDIIKNLKKLEDTAVDHIHECILQNYLYYLAQSNDTSCPPYNFCLEYKVYLSECLSKFIEYISEKDRPFIDARDDSSSNWSNQSLFFEEEFQNFNHVPAVTALETAATGQIKKARLLDNINPKQHTNTDSIPFFKHVADMLDLNNDSICNLLPYLLTAYVCSGDEIKIFAEGEAARSDIFDDFNHDNPDLDAHDPNRKKRRKEQIARLSKRFSLDGCILEYPEEREENPTPYYVDRKNPYHDALFAERIFEAFAVIVFDVANKKGEQIQKVTSKIDLASCYLLLLSYLDPDKLSKVPDQTIIKCLRSRRYSKNLLKAFRSHYEHYSF